MAHCMCSACLFGRYGQRLFHAVCCCRWATRCILSGYQEIDFPDRQQIKKIMNQPNLRYSASIPRMDELVWIAFSGRFRVCYIIVVQLMSGQPVCIKPFV